MIKPGRLFGIGVLIQIIVIGLVILAVAVGVSYVQEKGLKTIATELWEGTEADSTNTK